MTLAFTATGAAVTLDGTPIGAVVSPATVGCVTVTFAAPVNVSAGSVLSISLS